MKIAGIPVVDASRPLKLTISKRDTERGATKDPGACAAALALLREVDGCTQARVHIGRTYVKQGNRWVKYETSQAIRGEIIAFDKGGSFQPGEYWLRPIRPSQREGTRQGSNKPGARDKGSRNRTPSKKRAKPHIITGIRAHGANR